MSRSTLPPVRRAIVARLAGATALTMLAAGLTANTAQAYDPDVWDRVAQCESGGNWKINTGNGFYGGLQFYHPTWKGYGGQEYGGYAHQASKAEQIAIGRRVLHAQGPGAWPVCSVKAGLTKSNGGADPNAKPGDEVSPGPVTGYVKARVAANVRSGPGTDYSRVGSMPRGTEVSGTEQNGWLKLGNKRWISMTALSSSPVDGSVTRYVSANSAANVRSGPGNSYKVVDTVKRGTKVTGTLNSAGWLKIGNKRWIGPTVLSTKPV